MAMQLGLLEPFLAAISCTLFIFSPICVSTPFGKCGSREEKGVASYRRDLGCNRIMPAGPRGKVGGERGCFLDHFFGGGQPPSIAAAHFFAPFFSQP